MPYQIYDIKFKDGRFIPEILLGHIEMNYAYDEVRYETDYHIIISSIEMEGVMKTFSAIKFKGSEVDYYV